MNKPTSTALPREVSAAQKDSPHAGRQRTLGELERALRHTDAGVIARLRRSDTKSPPPDFYRISVEVLDDFLPEKGEPREREESGWALLVKVMAMALGTAPESGGLLGDIPFGKALAQAGVAERRVLRLLEAEGDQLADLVRHVVHQLVSKGQAFSPSNLAALILERDPGRRERARRDIARDFYRNHDGN